MGPYRKPSCLQQFSLHIEKIIWSRGIISTARTGVQLTQRRGIAVKGHKRPTMDEYLAPTEAFSKVEGRREARYNMYLLGGLSFFGGTLGLIVANGWIPLNNPNIYSLSNKLYLKKLVE